MKRSIMLTAIAMLMTTTAMAQDREIKVGDVSMTISPEKGAKIMSL